MTWRAGTKGQGKARPAKARLRDGPMEHQTVKAGGQCNDSNRSVGTSGGNENCTSWSWPGAQTRYQAGAGVGLGNCAWDGMPGRPLLGRALIGRGPTAFFAGGKRHRRSSRWLRAERRGGRGKGYFSREGGRIARAAPMPPSDHPGTATAPLIRVGQQPWTCSQSCSWSRSVGERRMQRCRHKRRFWGMRKKRRNKKNNDITSGMARLRTGGVHAPTQRGTLGCRF